LTDFMMIYTFKYKPIILIFSYNSNLDKIIHKNFMIISAAND